MGKKLTQEVVLSRFRETHGDRYDYSQVEYVHSQTKVVIICREHGPFRQALAVRIPGLAGSPVRTQYALYDDSPTAR